MKTFNLENEPKIDSGFKTPDNYFENFSANLMQKLPLEPISEETKVVSIFRTRKKLIMAAAAVLALAIMIPVAYRTSVTNREIDSVTLENYLAQETNLSQYELIGEIEPKSSNLISNTKELDPEALEDILASSPNIESLVIEEHTQNLKK